MGSRDVGRETRKGAVDGVDHMRRAGRTHRHTSRWVMAAALGPLAVSGPAHADHATDTAGGLWPLASLLILTLAFVLTLAVSQALERRTPRSEADDEARGGDR
jgi:hypothetical protein